MHDGGVVGGHLTRERWVEVCSAAPARMFGLAGVKGVVAAGADADLVVYDPARKHTISPRPTTWTSTTRSTRGDR